MNVDRFSLLKLGGWGDWTLSGRKAKGQKNSKSDDSKDAEDAAPADKSSGSGTGETSDDGNGTASNSSSTGNGESKETSKSGPANQSKDDQTGFSKMKVFAIVLFVGAAIGVALVATGYVQFPWVTGAIGPEGTS